MTKQEVSQLIMTMNALYPNWKPTSPIPAITSAWYMLLKDCDKDDINNALMIYVSRGEQFPPSNPGVLTSLLVDVKSNGMTEMQAWDLVLKAIRNGNYGAEEEFNALPSEIQKAVGSPAQIAAWAQLPSDEVQTVIQSNFQRSYRAAVKREQDNAKLPTRLKDLIDTATPKAIAMEL